MSIKTQEQNLNNKCEMVPESRWWNWQTKKLISNTTKDAIEQRTLFLNGPIAEESWFDDEVTPKLFEEELFQGEGDIAVWINSPGGDCIAAAQIYNMLVNYKGRVLIVIDGIAASAASVIAMAGDKVIASPVAMLMIHNPMTIAFGEERDMQRATSMLKEVKESIINAYEIKTGMDRKTISKLMDNETWMNVHSAMEYGFIDEIMERETLSDNQIPITSMTYQRAEFTDSLLNKLTDKCRIDVPKVEQVERIAIQQPTIQAIHSSQTEIQQPTEETAEETIPIPQEEPTERNIDELYNRLDLIKKHI